MCLKLLLTAINCSMFQEHLPTLHAHLQSQHRVVTAGNQLALGRQRDAKIQRSGPEILADTHRRQDDGTEEGEERNGKSDHGSANEERLF